MKKAFSGIYPALVTPYDKDGKINHNELKRLINWLLDKGVDGFYSCGSTSEVFLLSDEERRAMLETVVEANAHRGKVICHVGAISTAQAVSLAKHAESVGADAISAICPFYYKFSDTEIIRYYKTIMESTQLPMFIYNFPSLSGFSLSESVLNELKSCKTLTGVKFTSNDYYLMERITTKSPELTMWNGYDEMLCCGLIMGASGGVGSTYNIMPELIKKIYTSYCAGDLEAAREHQRTANFVIEALVKYGVFPSIKAILGFEGFDFGDCREPFSLVSDEGKRELREVYEKYIK